MDLIPSYTININLPYDVTAKTKITEFQNWSKEQQACFNVTLPAGEDSIESGIQLGDRVWFAVVTV